MTRQKLFTEKARIAARMADIASEHLSGDVVDEKLFREAMLLNMVHGVLSKEWEQRSIYEHLEEVRTLAKNAWHRWNDVTADSPAVSPAARDAMKTDLREIIDLIDEGSTE